jgi:hypothetical protein
MQWLGRGADATAAYGRGAGVDIFLILLPGFVSSATVPEMLFGISYAHVEYSISA